MTGLPPVEADVLRYRPNEKNGVAGASIVSVPAGGYVIFLPD